MELGGQVLRRLRDWGWLLLTGVLVLAAAPPVTGRGMPPVGELDSGPDTAPATPERETNPRRGTVLVVVAHPDDETLMMGGTLARLAAGGWRVVVLSTTRGEAGWIADRALATSATLGAVREQELRRACALLGLACPIVWDYPDRGLSALDPDAFTQAIVQTMREIRPQIVVTWGPDGGYGHPDHLAVHHAVTAACHVLRAHTGEPFALYYPVVRPPRLRRLLSTLRSWVHGQQAQIPAPPPITTRIDVRRYRRQRAAALAVYRSQQPGDPWLRPLAVWLAPRDQFAWTATEAFHRAPLPQPVATSA